MGIIIRNIFAILLIVFGGLACSHTLVDDISVQDTGSHKIILSGIVVDKDTNAPLEDIKITFSMYDQANPVSASLVKNVYTDNKGVYNISIETRPKKSRCTLYAESPDSGYVSSIQEINILWSGTSYDQNSGIFFVNNCNFQLIRSDSNETTH